MSAGDPLKVCLDGGARDDLILGPSNAKLGSTFRAQVGIQEELKSSSDEEHSPF